MTKTPNESLKPCKYQVNGLFEIPAENFSDALDILRNSGLKAIDIRILEIRILENHRPERNP